MDQAENPHRAGRDPDASPPPASTVPQPGARGTSGWVVAVALAGVLMTVLGAFHLAQGIGALVTDERFLLARSSAHLGIDTTVWGWLHAVVGAVMVVAGFLVFAGRRWARAVGVVMACLSALAALALLSTHPGWAVTAIVLDVVVILALTMHGSEIRAGG